MGKIEVVLVVLNRNNLQNAVATINYDNAILRAIIIEGGEGNFIRLNDSDVSVVSFASIEKILTLRNNVVWLIYGSSNNWGDIYKAKKFLMASGISEDNIVNFDVVAQTSTAWIGNIRYVEEHGVDYFATGISYTEVGLNLNCIPELRGVNLATSNQDLRQGYLTAKYIFDHVKPDTIKFVLIGLAPYSFRYDNIESFSVCAGNFQYESILQNFTDNTLRGQLLRILVSDSVKRYFNGITSKQADLNFDNLKRSMNNEFPVTAMIGWEDELRNLTKIHRDATVEKNLQILEEYIKLCLDNGAKPIAFVLPFAPLMRDKYDRELLISFRRGLSHFRNNYDFKVIDLFDLPLDYSNFYNMAHLNLKGAATVSTIISYELYENNVLALENFGRIKYHMMYFMSKILSREIYNSFVDKIFEINAEKIRRKDKINIGFVTYDASMWCGDDLYNLFAQDDSCNPTIFLCLRRDKFTVPKVIEDFQRGIKQFKDADLNVVGVTDNDAEIPHQDVLIMLTPYLDVLPEAFQLSKLTAETFLVYIPYSLHVSLWRVWDEPIFNICWKIFFETQVELDLNIKNAPIGMPRGYYSGYPKVDVFVKDNGKFDFAWKMARPDAKKIIYAPHWSLNQGVLYSTFQWNYQFMYDYAKAHPEISWVFKPHPNLLFSAVESGLFDSAEAFNEYLKAWDNLPNAKVVTGAYYQDIFATSDGMILDSGSFIIEYQYTHKPMIFLTRDTQTFNDFTNGLMQVSYRVDGRDLNGIANLMQKVFIDGNDEMYQSRRDFFDKYLNYVKANGMTASEYIFKNITQTLANTRH